ncbi:MAG: hypothetical protein QOK04_2960, partial [Solirubrobacteraceae bacterium]|nr:hypothetical protein [Solirubrobacteraceae bacterium]
AEATAPSQDAASAPAGAPGADASTG